MRSTIAAVLLQIALTILPAAALDCPRPPADLSVTEYQRQLDEIAGQVKSAESDSDFSFISNCLPDHWTIQRGASRFEIGSWAVRNDLYEIQKEKDPDERKDEIEELETSLKNMRDQAGRYDESSFPSERDRLNRILSKPEYRHAIGPGWQDQFKDRVYAFLLRILGVSIEHSSEILTLLRLLGWAIVLFVLALLMRVLLRWLTVDPGSSIASGRMAVSATHWTDWLEQARLAASENDWRRAIHFAYWAAISHLEAEGCWPADRARTPREYVRLMSEEGERRSLLVKLTRKFEYFWYAQHSATQTEYQETLTELESLGCR